ncbi:hypothetical protein SAMN05421678_108271 [Actinopolymorpha cephalotaxi]|uniref:PknH-like extracellular domain-containing protein n=1 Tax=Actinopolymorpha cephalotaxi TaxID=504797 RepID=A0A1I2UQ71_9ACTN|nr:hypothetical protein [Actinopolymorpha cephalotaxi]NYH86685.1 hypothetical protein [Actinopolymorpha cephalotaxi]SFG79138.1 hypothetical protein SAMN05421678_108271 [Actinopolymorpha cephalotaxi]
MPRFRRAFALVACCALAVAGCGSSDDDSAGVKPAKSPAKVAATRPAKPAKTPTPTPTPTPKTAAELKGAIGKIVLTDKEIGHDVEIQNQDDSLTTPTNDICGRKWAGDKKRLARNQDFFWESGKSASLVVSGEAVAYQPGTGAKALTEIRRAVGDCDGWKHDQGQIRDVTVVDPPSGALKGAFAWRGVDARDGEKYSYLAVYQADGDLLSAVYVWAGSRSRAREIAGQVVPKVADRLENAAN